VTGGWSRPARIIGGIGAVLLVAYLSALVMFPKPSGRIIIGDAVHHFVQLRSLVFDRDLQFQNEYVRVYGLTGNEPGTEWIFTDLTRTGHVRNYMPVGPALLWAPVYVAMVALHAAIAWLSGSPLPDGYERSLVLVPGAIGVIAAAGGAWFSYRLARRYARDGVALSAVVAVWLGTHALYYSLISPAYSHAASIFSVSLFCWRWVSTREAPSIRRAAEWGGLAGLAALMRWQDAVLIAIPAIELARWAAPWSRRVLAVGAAALGWLAVFTPQMVVWTVLYGQPFAIPQGQGFMQWTSPHPVAVLFSDNHGLLAWAPLLVLSLVGLWQLLRRAPELRYPLLVIVLACWYINAAVADWWGGEAFGGRRFLSLFPLFALGLAVWIDGREAAAPHRSRLMMVVGLAACNLLLLLQYQVFMKGRPDLAPYPHGWVDMWLTRFLVPVRVVAEWLS